MEHGRASIEIWFMMTQWELDRTSARYVIILVNTNQIQGLLFGSELMGFLVKT